jgi:uncharacterized membrane protein YhaH (DUF805 family)
MNSSLFFLSLAMAVGFGAWCAYIFERKGRDRRAGFWVGFLFGVFGLLIAYLLSSKKNSQS